MQPILRLPLHFDPTGLQRDLDAIGESAWVDHFVARNYQGAWRMVPLRGQAGAKHPILRCVSNPGCREWEDTAFLHASPVLQQVLREFRCPLMCVRLMKLSAGSLIKVHTDHDLDFALGQVRLHVPITSNSRVLFHMHGRAIHMAPGECWYMRFSDAHSVENRGRSDRVHLVIDAEVNRWLRELFESAARHHPAAV